jgi:acetyl esterase/lipase
VTGCLILTTAGAAQDKGGKTYTVKKIADVAYNGAKDADPDKHKLDLYLPEGAKDFPVLFYIHGGAWSKGSRKAGAGMGKVFASHGIGVASVGYRLSPAVTHPAHIEDVAQAFDWTYRNIGKYGGNPGAIFVSGHSAGGHLAALLASNPQYLKKYGLGLNNIKGDIPISGVFAIRPGMMPKVFGEDATALQEASPLRYAAKNCPPFLILYAEKDLKGMDKGAQAFTAALKKNGALVSVHEIKGRNHGTIVLQIANPGEEVARLMLDFIRDCTSANPKLIGD